MDFSGFRPHVNFATRYPFSKGQRSLHRICYSSSLFLIREGKGVVSTCGRTYETGPGSLVYIPAGQKHDWVADAEQPMVHTCCYFDWASIDRRAFFEQPHYICYDEARLLPALIGSLFPYPIPEHLVVEKLWLWDEWFDKFFTPNAYPNERTYIRSLQVQSQFQRFIEHFLSFALKDEHVPDPRVAKVVEQIDQDLLKGHIPQSFEGYYRSMRISRGYFFELFKKSTGMSPVQYINHFRINRAKEDLQFSSLTVTEIAEKHGFSSIHYFSKLFRQLTGRTPKEYRGDWR